MTIVQPDPTNPTEIERIWFEVDRLMQFIVEASDDFGVSLPTDHYFDLGEPVHDCPAVAIGIATTSTGIPEAASAGIGEFAPHGLPPMWTLTLVAEIIRCAAKPTSSGTVPRAKLIAQVKQASADTAVLMRAANRRTQDLLGQLTGNIEYLEPQGTSYATRLNISIPVH